MQVPVELCELSGHLVRRPAAIWSQGLQKQKLWFLMRRRVRYVSPQLTAVIKRCR